MIRAHLGLTLEEALAYLNGGDEASMGAYHEIHLQALEMADMLSDGMVRQSPKKFKGGGDRQ